MKKLLLILMAFLAVSCGTGHKKKKANSHVKVTCVHVRNSDDAWIYYYYMTGPDNSYYCYSTTSPVSNYSSMNWQRETQLPQDVQEAQQEPANVSTQDIPQADFNQDMQEVFNSNEEYFGGMNENEMGDYEGGPYSDGGSSNANSNNGNNEEESSDNSDSGNDSGGDSGGGDSGGGDGGGGGD